MSLFNFNKKKETFKITQTDRNWVEENFSWLISAAGYPDREASQLIFNQSNFPLTFEQEGFNANAFLNDCCNHLYLYPEKIQLEFFEDIRDLSNVPFEIEGQILDSYAINTENVHKVFLAKDLNSHPKGLIFNIIKQLLRIRMFENKWDFESGTDTELFLIISSVFYRFGLIISATLSDQGMTYDGLWERKWNRAPEIPEEIMAFCLALFSKLIAEEKPIWKEGLSKRMSNLYQFAGKHLNDFPSELFNTKELEAIDLYNQGVDAYTNNEFERAVEYCQKALFLTTNESIKADILNNIGYYLMRLEKFEESLNYFLRCLEINPGFAFANDNYGHALIQLGQLEKGFEYINKALDSDFNDQGYSYRNLGLFYHKKGDLSEALKNYLKAFENNTDSIELLDLLYGKLLLEQGKNEEGMKHIQLAVEKGEPEAIEYLAEIEKKQDIKKLILKPLEGLQIFNGKHLIFGDSKEKILEKIGEPSTVNNNQLFYDNFEFRIDLDENEKFEFIECIYGPFLEKTEVEIYGINPFKTLSSQLIQILTDKNHGVIDKTEEPYCYAFINSSIGVFRESCEDDIEEMISEMKELGTYEENKDQILEDKKKAKFFWTIGIGKKNYYG